MTDNNYREKESIMNNDFEDDKAKLIRLPQVLRLVPVSRSTWWEGVRTGTYPKPIKLGPKITCWSLADILNLISKGVG